MGCEGLDAEDGRGKHPLYSLKLQPLTDLLQSGTQPSKGLHILRASVRDADGKKYVFFIDESESWKLALGLQRLRKGSQVRSMQNSQMAQSDVVRILNSVPPLA